MLEEKDLAPAVTLTDTDGVRVDPGALQGRPLVIYFYPKDDTSGCTAEAKDFSRLKEEFERLGVTVVGVSPDSPASHEHFKNKYALSVRLVSDETKAAALAYGVWTEKSMYGKKYMGIERSTFLIGADGRIARIWRKVKVPGHAEAVLAAAHDLVAAT